MGYDSVTDKLSVLGGDASFSLFPGLKISGGVYKDVLPERQLVEKGPEGQLREIKKSIPKFGREEPMPDVRFIVTLDLTKLRRENLRRLRRRLRRLK